MAHASALDLLNRWIVESEEPIHDGKGRPLFRIRYGSSDDSTRCRIICSPRRSQRSRSRTN